MFSINQGATLCLSLAVSNIYAYPRSALLGQDIEACDGTLQIYGNTESFRPDDMKVHERRRFKTTVHKNGGTYFWWGCDNGDQGSRSELNAKEGTKTLYPGEVICILVVGGFKSQWPLTGNWAWYAYPEGNPWCPYE
eukprot:Pgem_evm1s12433